MYIYIYEIRLKKKRVKKNARKKEKKETINGGAFGVIPKSLKGPAYKDCKRRNNTYYSGLLDCMHSCCLRLLRILH
jgi:hypothetical protein